MLSSLASSDTSASASRAVGSSAPAGGSSSSALAAVARASRRPVPLELRATAMHRALGRSAALGTGSGGARAATPRPRRAGLAAALARGPCSNPQQVQRGGLAAARAVSGARATGRGAPAARRGQRAARARAAACAPAPTARADAGRPRCTRGPQAAREAGAAAAAPLRPGAAARAAPAQPAPAAAAAGAARGAGGGSWARGAAAAAAAAVAAGALAAGPAHAEPLAQLAQAMSALKIPGLVGDSQFTEGFVSSLLLIFFSEIGDKTFFIALLLALREDRTAVFSGTFGALAIMTVISVALGQVFHQLDELLPAASRGLPLDDLFAVALLLYFGISTLKGAADAGAKAAEEKEEAGEVVTSLAPAATAALVASTFSLVFAAEWGDKSFLATIALAAASDPAGVVAGAVTGHGLATGIAVAGGSLLSRYISEVTAQYIGGSLFLVFAAATVFDLATGAHGG
ncbi:PAM71 [Scenedesmus sp. PABB004]|nr:PAM71 [Scenedesmus sp. PABB004]